MRDTFYRGISHPFLSKRLGDAVFSLILLLHIFAFILINSYLYDCTCFIHSNPV